MPDANGNPTYFDILQSTDTRNWADTNSQIANRAAQSAYYAAQARGLGQNAALEAAKFAWQQKLDEANQTGMWNGQWNNPQEQWFTGQFGQWFGPGGAPGQGAYSMPAQQLANQTGALYGQYFAPGTNPYQGQATAAQTSQAAGTAQARAGLTGYLQNTGSGNIVADAWNMLDQATQQQYLQTSPGGNNAQEAMQRYYANYQNAVRNRAAEAGVPFTPETMNQAVYGAWGQGTETQQHQQQMWAQGMAEKQFQAGQMQLQQQNALDYLKLMSSLRGPADWAKYQQVLGSTPNGMRDLYAAAMGQYVPGGGATTGVAPQAASLQTMGNQIAGSQVWGSGIGVGQQQPSADQQAQAAGGGANMPAPNQVAMQSWNNMAPSQQQMMLGDWENQGWDINDVKALMNQSLPKYGSNTGVGGAGTWSLR